MPDAVTVAIALVITLGVFLAVRPLWRRRMGPDRQTADIRSNPEKNVVQEGQDGTR